MTKVLSYYFRTVTFFAAVDLSIIAEKAHHPVLLRLLAGVALGVFLAINDYEAHRE